MGGQALTECFELGDGQISVSNAQTEVVNRLDGNAQLTAVDRELFNQISLVVDTHLDSTFNLQISILDAFQVDLKLLVLHIRRILNNSYNFSKIKALYIFCFTQINPIDLNQI